MPALTCSQCKTLLEVGEDNQIFAVPICDRCTKVYKQAKADWEGQHNFYHLSLFTPSQAKQILDVIPGRATAWALEYPDYMQEHFEATIAGWGYKVFGLARLTDEEIEEELKRRADLKAD